MRCCVPGCKNDSRHISKSEGITFHVLPSELSLPEAWSHSVGKDSWKQHKRSVVCSEHFLCDDLYETKNGMRKVRAGAVPLILQILQDPGNREPASLKVCRICLVTDSKLFPMRKYKLDQAYEHLTGSPVSVEDKLPQKLCYECVQRLQNCASFRTKSLRAASLMLEVVKKQDHLTIQNLKSINRINNQLTSNLTPKYIGSDHYDYLLEDNTSEKIEDVPSPISNEEYLQEFEDSLDVEDTHNGTLDDSSDYNLPLEVRKRKKIKPREKRVRKKSNKEVEEEFKCLECVKTFLDQDEYYSHMASHDKLTIQNLKSINRINNQLTSNLTPKYIGSDHYDYLLEDDRSEKIEDVPSPISNEEYLQEFEDSLDVEDTHNGTLDYSSDYYLPLEVRKRKKIKPREKRVIKKSNKEVEEEFKCMECVKTFLDQDEYYSHMASHDKSINPPLDSTTDDSMENFEPEFYKHQYNDSQINKQTNNLNTDQDSKLNYENDVEIDDDYVVSEEDYTTDDSVVLEVKRKKKETKELKKRAEKKNPEPKTDRRKPFLSDDLNVTLFTITDLTYEEQVAEIEKRQESSNYKNAVFKCTECYKGFLDYDAYNSHILRHTDECGEHRCSVCKIHFKQALALRKHITARHTQRFSCKQCPYVTANKQSARFHERWHKGTKYTCPHCPEEFLKFTTYLGHIRIKHPSDFVCQLCGYSFVSEKGIALHKKLKHRQEDAPIPDDGPQCELCNIRFIDSEALKRHISVSARHNSVDKGSKEPNTPSMGRKSRESKERAKRAKEESKLFPSQLRKAEGPIPCEQCGIQLEDSRAYHNHFRRMHPDKNRTNYPSMKSPCMCEVCGKIFQSYALLNDHRWTHTGERPFKCDSCDKSFRMKQRLVTHQRVHSAQKPRYACTECGKHFSSQSNQQRHMFVHTGLKPFKCEMCGKFFKYAGEKRSHVEYVHLKKPWPKRNRGKRRSDRLERPDARQVLVRVKGQTTAG